MKVSIDYLHSMQLLNESEELQTRLNTMTKKWTNMVTQAKQYQKMNKIEQEVFDNIKSMNEYHEKKDAENLAKILVMMVTQVKILKSESTT